MATQRVPFVSVEEYLAMEKASTVRHEYLAGEVFAMAGGSPDHNRIAQDTSHCIASQLRGRGCEDFGPDQRVQTGPAGLYTYPDLTVVCGKPEFVEETLTNATAVFEVLSSTTEAYDRGEKFRLYQRIPTLKLYVLVSQDKPQVETFVRQADGDWSYSLTEGLDSMVQLPAIGCALKLAEIYARVQIEQADDGMEMET